MILLVCPRACCCSYGPEEEAQATENLWRRLSTLHNDGALIGCSHRCQGVDHDTDEGGGGGGGRSSARPYGVDEEDLYKVSACRLVAALTALKGQ